MLSKFTFFTLFAVSLFVCEAAFSNNLPPQKLQSPQVSSYEFNNLICFMKKTNGTIVDLQSLCDRPDKNLPKVQSTRKPKEYDYQRIKNFNRRVYGD